jgi:hypothetical protein
MMRLPFLLYPVRKPRWLPRWKIRDLLTGFTGGGNSILVQTDIVNIGLGSGFRFDRLNRMGVLKNRHFLSRIEKVPEYPCTGGTSFHTGGLETGIYPVRTEGTLLNDLLNGMDISDRIRTSRHTISASNTDMGIDHHDPIFPLE